MGGKSRPASFEMTVRAWGWRSEGEFPQRQHQMEHFTTLLPSQALRPAIRMGRQKQGD
jgi:hypothetical protein